jgi:hypothetical protein
MLLDRPPRVAAGPLFVPGTVEMGGTVHKPVTVTTRRCYSQRTHYSYNQVVLFTEDLLLLQTGGASTEGSVTVGLFTGTLFLRRKRIYTIADLASSGEFECTQLERGVMALITI